MDSLKRKYFGALLGVLLSSMAVTCGSSERKRVAHDMRMDAGDGGVFQAAAGGGGDAALVGTPTSDLGSGGTTGAAGAPVHEGGGATAGVGTLDIGGGSTGGETAGGGGGSTGTAGEGGAGVSASVFYDDFDGEVLLTDQLYTVNHLAFQQWIVASGSVDITVLPNGFIDSPGGYGPAEPADSVVVDLNGSTNEAGIIESKLELEFTAGVSYTLSYSLGNARPERNSVLISIPGLVAQTRSHPLPSTAAFTTYQETFTPAITVVAKLRFTSQGDADNDGLLLDNVSIIAMRR